MLSRTFLASAAVSIVCVCHLVADPIDPFSPLDFPDPSGQNGLLANAPICFSEGSDTDCLDDVELMPGSVTDAYDFGPNDYELDSLTGIMSADVYVDGDYEGEWLVPYDGSTVDDRTSPSSYGLFDSEMPDFGAEGNMGVLGNVEIDLDPQQAPPVSSTTINTAPGGFQISSFFDIFTEISLDGGNTWTPSSPAQTRLDLVQLPEPGSSALTLAGAISLLALLARRKQTHRASNS